MLRVPRAAALLPMLPPMLLATLLATLLAMLLAATTSTARAQVDRAVPPTFSVERGLFDAPISVELRTVTPGAAIRYTTDGSPPAANRGTVYSGPIRVERTTVLRAAAFVDGLGASAVMAHTYIFPADVIRQQRPSGYPTLWSGEYPGDYEMDPEVVASYRTDLLNGLDDLPSVSLAFERDTFFGAGGIYQNPRAEGRAWERPVSIELIHPSGEPGFSINAGARIHGGSSRKPTNSPKHSFRLYFRSDYGPTKLEYDLFDQDLTDAPNFATDEFDVLILRAGYNQTWVHKDADQREIAQYARDVWAQESHRALGRNSGHGRHVHLYLNGLYWGVYALQERPDANFQSEYFGTSDSNYDVINAGVAIDGNLNAFNDLIKRVEDGVSTRAEYEAIARRLDIDAFIDYMILNQYAGNTDFDGKNWYAARRRDNPASTFQFFSWDAEHILKDERYNVLDEWEKQGPTYIYQKLKEVEEFRVHFADRIYAHLYNNGALTPARAGERYRAITELLIDAIVGESARWGDYRRDTDPGRGELDLYLRDDDWLDEREELLEEYFPVRSSEMIRQYRNAGVYPLIDPPRVSHRGGLVLAGHAVTLRNPNGKGELWYTTDGSDPRAPFDEGTPRGTLASSGAVVYITQSTRLRMRVRTDAEWSALHEVDFFVQSEGVDALKVSEIFYNPTGSDDSEFIEFVNSGDAPIDLSGAFMSDGIDYAFPPGTTLAPGGYLVLARYPELFVHRYGFAPFNDRGYRGQLSNGGERIALSGLNGEELWSIDYNDQGDDVSDWPLQADGSDFSLVRANGSSGDWRASAQVGGSPGAADPTPRAALPVAISEIMSYGGNDFIEIHNQGDEPVDVSGWFLTNDRGDPKRFTIPAGTVLPPDDYRAFSASTLGFALDDRGGEVLLLAGNGGVPTGYASVFVYGPALNGSSFAICQADVPLDAVQPGLARERLVLVDAPTPDFPNRTPLISPVVISEIMYNPASGSEYIELYNRADFDVLLENKGVPFRIGGVGGFDLPPGLMLTPGETLLVSEAEPAALRSQRALSDGVRVVGPYPGALRNGGERVALLMPRVLGLDGVVFYVEVDAVTYSDASPWPAEADGGGMALERVSMAQPGDDPLNWQAAASPGVADEVRLLLSPSGVLTTSEGGASATVDLSLSTPPNNVVRVGLATNASAEGEVTITPNELVFSVENWQTPQRITITGVDDALADGDRSVLIEATARSTDRRYAWLVPQQLHVINADDEPAVPAGPAAPERPDEANTGEQLLPLVTNRYVLPGFERCVEPVIVGR